MTRYHVPPATAEGVGYTIVENAPLDARNTFRVAARAKMLIDVRRKEALAELFGFAALKRGGVLVLGEGSNIVFAHDVDGVVLSIATRGIETIDDDGRVARLRVAAGENWNDFVHFAIARGFAGLENLVAIPGTVGAAPVQNIGAYGVELREFVHRVEAWDRAESCFVTLANDACGFAYRDSLFKREPDRYVITAVDFELPRERAPKLDYAGVREELAALGIDTAEEMMRPAAIAEAITRIRARKLPDPRVIGNAGSFFHNPVVAADVAEALRGAHPTMPQWPQGHDHVKIPAAWLVEAAGFKGFREGDVGVSDAHALVLVNHGHASGAEIVALAERIRAEVRARFGVDLQPEPKII
jgi:UDP-N-acetylmuramate dehydrogenase